METKAREWRGTLPKFPSPVSDRARLFNLWGSNLWGSRSLVGFMLPLFSQTQMSEVETCSQCEKHPSGGERYQLLPLHSLLHSELIPYKNVFFYLHTGSFFQITCSPLQFFPGHLLARGNHTQGLVHTLPEHLGGIRGRRRIAPSDVQLLTVTKNFEASVQFDASLSLRAFCSWAWGLFTSVTESRIPGFRQGKWAYSVAGRVHFSKHWQKHQPRPHMKGDKDLHPERVVEG